jgi:hypothetical protein
MLVLGLVMLLSMSCEPATSPSPKASLDSIPAISIDQSWTSTDNVFTFTGSVDPQSLPTLVVLEIGVGPQGSGVFGQSVPVSDRVISPGPVSVQVKVPTASEVCVRFTATNEAGTSSSRPLCIPNPPARP